MRSVLSLLLLAILEIALILAGAGRDQAQILGWIWSLSLAITLLLGVIIYQQAPWHRRGVEAGILTACLLLHQAICWSWIPSLSDDLFRYRHDGQLVLRGLQPYSHLPRQTGVILSPFSYLPTGGAVSLDPLHQRINNPILPSVYLPTSQWVFGLGAWLEKQSIRAGWIPETPRPAHRNPKLEWLAAPALMPYRQVHLWANVAAVGLLLALLRVTGRSPWWALFYGCHPLSLIEIAGNGHLESVGVALMLATFLALHRKHGILCGVLAGLMIMTRPWAFLILPALAMALRRERDRWRLGLLIGWGAMLPLLLGWACFGAGFSDLLASLGVMKRHWCFNGPIYELLRQSCFHGYGDRTRRPLDLLAMAFQSLLLLWAWRRQWSPYRWLSAAWLGVLWFSPQVYPWYLLTPLALVPLAPQAGVMILSVTLLWSYQVLAIWDRTGRWFLPNRWLWAQWAPGLWAFSSPVPGDHQDQVIGGVATDDNAETAE